MIGKPASVRTFPHESHVSKAGGPWSPNARRRECAATTMSAAVTIVNNAVSRGRLVLALDTGVRVPKRARVAAPHLHVAAFQNGRRHPEAEEGRPKSRTATWPVRVKFFWNGGSCTIHCPLPNTFAVARARLVAAHRKRDAGHTVSPGQHNRRPLDSSPPAVPRTVICCQRIGPALQLC